jgi:hypothetical protein
MGTQNRDYIRAEDDTKLWNKHPEIGDHHLCGKTAYSHRIDTTGEHGVWTNMPETISDNSRQRFKFAMRMNQFPTWKDRAGTHSSKRRHPLRLINILPTVSASSSLSSS